jgi:lipoprotein-anchoring transpeptidase ErfK/SrfK
MEPSNRHDVAVTTQVTKVKRGGSGTRFLVVLLAITGLGSAATLTGAIGVPTAGASDPAAASPATVGSAGRSAAQPVPQPAALPPAQEVLPASAPLAPSPAVLEQGDTGPRVRVVQARLRQLGWYAGKVTDHYRRSTTRAVRHFQARHDLPRVGHLDRDTAQQLRALTRRPTRDELANRTVAGQGGGGTWTTGALDRRCRTGRVLCIDKSTRTIRWVLDGEVRLTMAVRFGASYSPTREGAFHVGWKSRDHVSKLYESSMPFAMFFSGGQAVHYSSDFAARGYSGASHGCVNVRDYNGIKWLFDQVRVGDTVVVYWS